MRVLTTVCLDINCKVHASCDWNFIVKSEGLLYVTGSHVHWKIGYILEMVLDLTCKKGKWGGTSEGRDENGKMDVWCEVIR